MSGITKRKYDSESMRILKQVNRELSFIKLVLPKVYDRETIFSLYQTYFPSSIKMLSERYEHYQDKDKFLKSVKKKIRYKPLTPQQFVLSSHKTRHIISNKQKEIHQKNYNEEQREKSLIALEQKLNKKILKQQKKEKSNEYIQNIEPVYLDIFIKLYHKANHHDKVIIVSELKKFNTEKIIQFFYKLNDAERNNQLRNMAFQHLQSLGRYVKLRKNFKGKKKTYHIDKSLPDFSPKELLNLLNTNSVEAKKTYDIFISHSYLDKKEVHALKCGLNHQNLSCYYDWTSDKDFLKRTLLSSYTEQVLKKRIEQSHFFLLLLTDQVIIENQVTSEWIRMEIEHAKSLGKKIYTINLSNLKHDFTDISFEVFEDKILITKECLK